MPLTDVLATAAGSGAPWLEDARSSRILRRADLPALVGGWDDELERRGVPVGAPVGLLARDPVATGAAWLAILAAGRLVAPLAADLPEARLAAWRADVAPAAVVEPDLPVRLRTAPPRPGGGVLLASSGTTGRPKLVRLDAEQLLHTARSVASAHALGPADRAFNPLPLHHINAEVVGLLATLVSGGAVVLDGRFHRTGFWELLAEREITWLNAVPAILAVLARTAPPPVPLPRLRFARSASAPLPAPVRSAFEARTGLPVIETYGMTEAGSQITAGDLVASVPGSVGRAVGLELRVVDEAGRALPDGAAGQVQIRGPGVITTYATPVGAEAFTADGFLTTGDWGWLEQGWLFLAGRRDDIINRGGEKIFPAQVEDVLLADPDVRAAAVVGWPDEILGQVPVAAVTPAPGADRDALVDRLARACAQQLDPVRRPVRFHLVEHLPGGVNGKVSRARVLEELLAATAPAVGT